MPRLRRSDLSRPGLTRRRRGRGWSYHDQNGARVQDPAVVERIQALAIPPAWQDVWICPWPHGHIQAVGTDDAGRRQYRYHEAWHQQRAEAKFDRVLDFAERLPAARERIAADLQQPGMPREKVLAAAFRLLELGFFRIGGEEYAEQHQTYGLATLRREHVTVRRDGTLVFDYPAKSGRHRVQQVVDDELAGIVRTLRRRRGGGPELLAWRERRRWRDIRSTDINDYLREVTDGDFTAKDFRTWNATVLAAVGLAVSSYAADRPTARRRAVTRVIKEVSQYLGNTPAVCRSSYVDPRVVDLYEAGRTILPTLSTLDVDEADGPGLMTHGLVEQAVLDLLRDREPASRAG